MGKKGYNKGRGNLKKIIFHSPTTNETFTYEVPAPKPKVISNQKNLLPLPQLNFEDMKLIQPINSNYKDDTQMNNILPEPDFLQNDNNSDFFDPFLGWDNNNFFNND